MKWKILALFMAVGCLPVTAEAREAEPETVDIPMWIEPMSWDEIRAQRAKMKAAMKASGKQAEKGSSRWKGGDKASGTKKGDGKKRKASSYMRRTYYIRSGVFPMQPGGAMAMKPRSMDYGAMKQPVKPQPNAHAGMSHGEMDHGAMPVSRRPESGRNQASMNNTVLWVTFPDTTVGQHTPKQRGKTSTVSFPSGDGGWYRLFAYNDLGVRDGSWVQLMSHGLVFSHGDEPDERKQDAPTGPGLFEGRPILEIERLCDDHDTCYRAHTGHTLHIRASFKGKKLSNTSVTLTTEKGWSQTKRTDANGEAVFTLIKEEFPDEIDTRKSEMYLLTLEHVVEEMGMLGDEHFHNQRYVATYPLKVYPSRLDWESQTVGFYSLGGVVLVTAGAIAVRRRRRRPEA